MALYTGILNALFECFMLQLSFRIIVENSFKYADGILHNNEQNLEECDATGFNTSSKRLAQKNYTN